MSGEMVSVVIPCRNEAKSIAATVNAILRSQHRNLEVIVVDGMSTDGTRSIVGELMGEDARVKLVDNPHKLTPFAFNIGIKNAVGDYIQIVGARNILEPSYIPLLLKTLQTRARVACAGGDYQHVHDTTDGQAISLAMESKFGVGGGNYRTLKSDAYVDTVGIPMYRASIFKELGYFDESLTRNQDDEFNFRLRRKGFLIMYVHEAKATYLVRASLEKAFKQYQQYGYFKVYVNKKHAAVTTVRQLAPAIFVAFLVLIGPLMLWKARVFWPLLFWTAAAYVTLGLLLAGPNLLLIDRVRALRACFVLHMGYGTGYWLGIWDFLINNSRPRASMQSMTT
ncbi:MAG: glycosyltransferase family 2 protein [Bdellovibrionales bacterium]|nr:glycosyltransferase family 2 protein [Bdellovibrionales bacterium]